MTGPVPPAPTADSASDGISSLDRFDWLDDAARDRLSHYVSLLRKWQATHNLVSPNSVGQIWSRHVTDSLQLWALRPDGPLRWIDLGSGGGFPGLALAVAVADDRQLSMTLVETNRKKAGFLRAAAREVGIPVEVVAERIEHLDPARYGGADVISARALAPLDALFRLAHPLCGADSLLLLLKGRDFVCEVAKASKYWAFDLVDSESVTDSASRVLCVRRLTPKSMEQ